MRETEDGERRGPTYKGLLSPGHEDTLLSSFQAFQAVISTRTIATRKGANSLWLLALPFIAIVRGTGGSQHRDDSSSYTCTCLS
ncbi:hypothetical protein DENSPDRAFT_598096 [Dentipellis sp. KUC8613]|nr:hypothetical protein DENSPDRAFT_598096 [Dentipellis sp. KUC8613]